MSVVVYVIVGSALIFISVGSGGLLIPLLPSLVQTCNFVISFINKTVILPKENRRLFDHIIESRLSLRHRRLPRGVLNSYLPGYYGETTFGTVYRNTAKTLHPLVWVMRLCLCFVVNLIPLVGPVLVVLIRAPTSGFARHSRYFHLKGYTDAQTYYIWAHRRRVYFVFGLECLLLESLPILGYMFVFTNVIGAAFWAADIEDSYYRKLLENRAAPRKEEQPPG